MLGFLRIYGALGEAGNYNGCDRAGYAKTAGAGDEVGVLKVPIDMHILLDENFWHVMLFDEQFDMQATMFQPVEADRIPCAFTKSLVLDVSGFCHLRITTSNTSRRTRATSMASRTSGIRPSAICDASTVFQYQHFHLFLRAC